MSRWLKRCLLLIGLLSGWVCAGTPEVHFAVLAFRPKPDMLARWQPVADYLQKNLPSHRVVLEALDYPELEQAIREKKVDLVLTQPAHYVALSIRENLYSPLATLIESQNGQSLHEFGGVIVVQAGSPLRSLSDLRNQKIAVSSRESLGGFLTQAYELHQLGIPQKQLQIIEVGQQDAVLKALSRQEVAAGFVRTGLLEQLADEGKIRLAEWTVLKPGQLAPYPLLLSTRLYPQWALAAMPWLDIKVSKLIAGAVLDLPADSPVARAAHIEGFTIPGDYRSVDRLMQALRVPPYDQRVPLQIIWEDYRPLLLLIGVWVGIGLAWVWKIRWRTRLQLAEDQRILRESEQHFRTLANNGTALIRTSGVDKGCDYFNEPWLQFTGRALADELGDGWLQGVHPADLRGCMATYLTSFDERKPFVMEYRLHHADGSFRWICDQGNPRYDSDGNFLGYIGFCYDITAQKQIEGQLRQAASVFNHANEGILITQADATITDVNEAFTRITGFARDEVLGKTPRVLKSGRQPVAFYAQLWNALLVQGEWAGEVWNRRKNGELYAALMTISTVHGASPEELRYVALFSDITGLKEQQSRLEHIAHFDLLTQLPNRVLLSDRLEQAIVQAQRRETLIAIAYIDLDGFKGINDAYGHLVGDHLLVKVSEHMKTVLREGDTLARIGGDEFVAILLDLESRTACIPIIERLLAASALPVYTDGLVLNVSASIGVSFSVPHGETEVDELLRQADQAMYFAKQSGKNRYSLPPQDCDHR